MPRRTSHGAYGGAMTTPAFRAAIWAKPGSRRTEVGGGYGEPPALVVRVAAVAADGAANKAVLAALADAFGVRRSSIRIIAGHTSRAKRIEILEPPADLPSRWADLAGR